MVVIGWFDAVAITSTKRAVIDTIDCDSVIVSSSNCDNYCCCTWTCCLTIKNCCSFDNVDCILWVDKATIRDVNKYF